MKTPNRPMLIQALLAYFEPRVTTFLDILYKDGTWVLVEVKSFTCQVEEGKLKLFDWEHSDHPSGTKLNLVSPELITSVTSRTCWVWLGITF